MSIAVNQAEDFTLLQLDGVIDIGCAAELKARLLEALEAGREIRVSFDAIEDLDITAFQLLWAAVREATRRGQELQVSGNGCNPKWLSLMGIGVDQHFKELTSNGVEAPGPSQVDER